MTPILLVALIWVHHEGMVRKLIKVAQEIQHRWNSVRIIREHPDHQMSVRPVPGFILQQAGRRGRGFCNKWRAARLDIEVPKDAHNDEKGTLWNLVTRALARARARMTLLLSLPNKLQKCTNNYFKPEPKKVTKIPYQSNCDHHLLQDGALVFKNLPHNITKWP